MVDTKLIILISLALLDIINHHRMILFYYIRFRALSVHYVFNTLYFLPYSHRHYLLSWAVVTHPISKLFQDKTLDKIFVIKRIIYPQYNFTPKLSQLRNDSYQGNLEVHSQAIGKSGTLLLEISRYNILRIELLSRIIVNRVRWALLQINNSVTRQSACQYNNVDT